MVKKVLLVLVLFLAAAGVGLYFSKTAESLFVDKVPWVLAISAFFGIVVGAARAVVKGKPEIVGGEVNRHGVGSFVEHWGTAIGAFILIASAFMLGFLFFPSFAKTRDAAVFPLNMHFIGVVIALFGGFFFAADFAVSRNYSSLVPNINDIIGGTIAKYFLRRKWLYEGKYLSSQKAAWLAFAVLIAGVFATGVIKVAAHVWRLQASVYSISTYIHDIFALLFILLLLVHVLLVVGLGEWPALISWVTGKMSEEYVKEEHPVWYEELTKGD
jgi:cytochrome b subunit of formate dehydrogenase